MKHQPFSRFLSVVLIFILSLIGHMANAATKYVSTTGNNTNSGNSWAQAWLTLQYAVNNIGAGDTVWIANGNYVGFDIRHSGTAGNLIVFIAAGNSVVINSPTGTTDGINVEDADYIEINGVKANNLPRNGIRLVNAHNCIVRNTYCDHNQKRGIFTGFTDDLLLEYNECLNSIDEHGIYVSNSSDRSIIRYNICHNNRGGGIQINADESQGGDGISSNPRIYGNILYENGVGGGAAINLDGVQGAFIYNNLLYENHASGIALFQQDGAQPSFNDTIVQNTIVNASNSRWCILIVNGSTGAKVYNNIIINQNPNKGSIALDANAVPGFNSDYNIVVDRLSKMGDGSYVSFNTWQTYGYDAHSLLADALTDIFVMPGSDYHLLTDAQAINAGNGSFSFGVNNDIEEVSRPQGNQFDIGAYEAEGPLAIETDHVEHGHVIKSNPGIIFDREFISWPDGLSGKMNIMTVEAKVVTQLDLTSSGEYLFQNLVPGIYAASVFDRQGIQWGKWFVWSGE
jgi:hypothetical protein